MENKLLKFFKKISTFENGNTTLKDWSKGGLEPTLLILLWKPVLHVRGEVRFWRAGTGHVRGGGQYDLMESVSAKGGFEPASELTSKQVRSKIESYGFGLRGIGLAVTKQTPTVTKQTLQSPNSSCSHQTAPSLFNDLKINIYYHF